MGVLRLFLAIAVFIFHANIEIISGIHTLDGRTAVFCFFVVSGFYMEMVLTEKYTSSRLGKDWIKKFWLARFFRLYPTYIIVGLLTIAVAVCTPFVDLPTALVLQENTNLLAILKTVALWFLNLTMVGLNLPSTSDLLIGPGWSLGIETAFYVIAPFTLRLNTGKLLVLSSIGVALQLIPYGQHAPILFGFHFFLLGALAHRYNRVILSNVRKVWEPRTFILILIVIAFTTIALPNNIYIGIPNIHSHNLLDRFIYPFLLAGLIPLLHEYTKKNKTDYWIGQLSYPFYLLHELIIDLFSNWQVATHKDVKHLILFFICIGMSAILVLVESKYVEPWRTKFMR